MTETALTKNAYVILNKQFMTKTALTKNTYVIFNEQFKQNLQMLHALSNFALFFPSPTLKTLFFSLLLQTRLTSSINVFLLYYSMTIVDC